MVNFEEQKILIVSPHIDDEVIGCGGLIAKVKKHGGKVYVIYLVNGDTKDFSQQGVSKRSERMQELESVSKYLHLDDYELVFKKNKWHLKLDKLPQLSLVNIIEREARLSIEKIKPTIVLSTHPDSYNQDHRAAAWATFTACRPSARSLKHQPSMVLSYESPADQWSLEKVLTPNFFVELSNSDLRKKVKALRLYKSQLREHANLRSPKSITGMAVIRGAQSGCEFAEAFYCHRFLA